MVTPHNQWLASDNYIPELDLGPVYNTRWLASWRVAQLVMAGLSVGQSGGWAAGWLGVGGPAVSQPLASKEMDLTVHYPTFHWSNPESGGLVDTT